nr:hypothetical protein [Kribbella monticola]
MPADGFLDQVRRSARFGEVDLDHGDREAVGEQVEFVAAVQRAGHDRDAFLRE